MIAVHGGGDTPAVDKALPVSRREENSMQPVLNQDLFHLLEKYGSNRVERELLIFWSRHPNAKFGRLAMFYAIDCHRSELDNALRAQVEAKLVDICCEHGQTFYSLTGDETKRQSVLALAGLQWGQRQSMLDSLERRGRVGEPVRM